MSEMEVEQKTRKRRLSDAGEDPGEAVALDDRVDKGCKKPRRTTLTVNVTDPGLAPIAAVSIYVTNNDANNPHVYQPANGEQIDVAAATYTIRAYKQWHAPIPAEVLNVAVAADQHVVQPMQLEPLTFHLHVDADRDGVVDAARAGINNWRYGTANNGRIGAIMLCNNDDDDAANQLDHADQVVNGNNDHTEIAPIEIRREGANHDPSARWTAQLSILHGAEGFVRIFDGRAQGAAQVAGSGIGDHYDLPNLNFANRLLGIEATSYAVGAAFAGLVTLRLMLWAPTPDATLAAWGAPGVTYTEDAQFRVAPWMIASHLTAAAELYATDLAAGGGQAQFLLHVDAAAQNAAVVFTTIAGNTVGGDIWMQDTMELGQHTSPHASFRVINQGPRIRGLNPQPRRMLAQDLGYVRPAAPQNYTTFDSTGNLEVTPPVTASDGTRYPYGRIYYCRGDGVDAIDVDFENFLIAQRVQAPFHLDSSFMNVGHVDEIISFVPDANGSQGFRLLIASPRRAYDLIRQVANVNAAATILTGKPGHATVQNFLLRNVPDPTNAANPPVRLLRYNCGVINNFTDVETSLDRVLAALVPILDLGIPAGHPLIARLLAVNSPDTVRAQNVAAANNDVCDVIEVPVVFGPSAADPRKADGETVDMVNMVVANGRCIVPWPYGPYDPNTNVDAFAGNLEASLNACGLQVDWVDSWYYHERHGGVHCGTNTLRQLQAWNWWEYPN